MSTLTVTSKPSKVILDGYSILNECDTSQDEFKGLRHMDVEDRAQQRQRVEVSHERFAFIGGHLALDFANTLGGRRWAGTRELLITYADLVAWGLQAGIVAPDEAQRFLEAAQRDAPRAALALERARKVREVIYALVTPRMCENSMRPGDLAALNCELAVALAHRRLATGPDDRVVWSWDWRETRQVADAAGGDAEPFADCTPDAILWPIAVAAADLLTTRDDPLLRECASDECSWLYLDTTRNHSRRWCDMKGCGNKAKVRRYRQRQAS